MLLKMHKKRKKEKKAQKVNKNLGTNVQTHYLYFISLICLNIYYFTWLLFYLDNEICALHSLINTFLGKKIFVSQVGIILLKKKRKNEKMEPWSQLGKEMEIMSILAAWLVRIDTHLFAHAPRCSYHSILLCVVKNGRLGASCGLEFFGFYIFVCI